MPIKIIPVEACGSEERPMLSFAAVLSPALRFQRRFFMAFAVIHIDWSNFDVVQVECEAVHELGSFPHWYSTFQLSPLTSFP